MTFRAIGTREDVSCPKSILEAINAFTSLLPPTPNLESEPEPQNVNGLPTPNGPPSASTAITESGVVIVGSKSKGTKVAKVLESQMPKTKKKRVSKRNPIPDDSPLLQTRFKRCTTCKEKQTLASFAKHDTSSDGRASICNRCRNKRNTNRRQTNPDARLKHLLVARILRNHPDIPELTRDLELYLGYRIRALREKLDSQCNADFGMPLLKCIASGEYHIDHRMPLSHFKIETPGDEQFRTCWHPDNLKVITAEENRAKGATMESGFDISQINTSTESSPLGAP